MKKIIVAAFFAAVVTSFSFAQERKPVIGLSEFGVAKGATLKDDNIQNQVRVAFSSAIVNSKRFAVMERSAADLEKLRKENVETSGQINPNSQLDFLLTGEIVSYETVVEKTDLVLTSVEITRTKLVVSVKFTDVHTGQIVLSEVITKEEKGNKVTADLVARSLADELIARIVTKLYPPIVLSVSGEDKVIQTTNAAYNIGDVLEVYANGEELLDPYTGGVIGYEEELVALVVVFEINDKTGIVKAAPIPKGPYTKADIQKGQMVRAHMVTKGKKTVADNDKSALSKFKSAGIIKK